MTTLESRAAAPSPPGARENVDEAVVAGFGDEWERFDQLALSDAEHETLAQAYFAVFPWSALPANATGFDLGCGSGRWARYAAPRVGTLHCIDPSPRALQVARRALADAPNARFHLAPANAIPLDDDSQDFGYSLGVLHHVPDTRSALRQAVRKLRRGAPMLLYLYYRFDNRPAWFRGVWRASELLRGTVSRLPHSLRYGASQLLAASVYWPLARTARAVERLGVDVRHFPLAEYRARSFYVMRTDALDRFGTRLEQRFTRAEIAAMMQEAGLRDVRFSEGAPYWCAVGVRA